MTLSARVVGRRKAAIVERPVEIAASEVTTLRDLVEKVVAAEVQSFRDRDAEQSVLRVLTSEEIADGAEAGKVVSGETQRASSVTIADAVATALLAHSDGLYQVVVDDEPVDSLNDEVSIRNGTTVLFLRLVALAGG